MSRTLGGGFWAVFVGLIGGASWLGCNAIAGIELGTLATTDGGPADAAARWLRQIDAIRDEHGMPEIEPRHPDLASGKPWPIMQPDPDAASVG